MKKLLWFLLLILPLYSQTRIAADCSVPFTFTATGRVPSSGFPAGASQTGCVGWVMVMNSTGFSALSLQLESAPDASGVAGSWVAFSGSSVALTGCGSTNPITATTQACLSINGYNPWVSVHLTSATGSGSITGYLYGCRIDHCAALFQTAGGGGGTSNVNIVQVDSINTPALNGYLGTLGGCASTATVALSGTGYNTIIAASASTKFYVCYVAWTSASGGNPSVNTLTLATGSCAGSPTTRLVMAGVTGYSDNWGGAAVGAGGDAFCAKESVANADTVTVFYSQF